MVQLDDPRIHEEDSYSGAYKCTYKFYIWYEPLKIKIRMFTRQQCVDWLSQKP